MREDFYEQSLTHAQRLANCITRMSELSEELYKFTIAHPELTDLPPLMLRFLSLFGNLAEATIGLNSDVQEMALTLGRYELGALADIPLDTPDDTTPKRKSTLTPPSQPTQS